MPLLIFARFHARRRNGQSKQLVALRSGRQVYPLLVTAGFEAVRVSRPMIYVDASRPDLAVCFARKTFTAMIEGVREPAISAGLIQPESVDAGIRDLLRSTEQGGVFCYTFFKGMGMKRLGA